MATIFPKRDTMLGELRAQLIKVNPMFENVPEEAISYRQASHSDGYTHEGKQYECKLEVTVNPRLSGGIIGTQTVYINRRHWQQFEGARLQVSVDPDLKHSQATIVRDLISQCNLGSGIDVGFSATLFEIASVEIHAARFTSYENCLLQRSPVHGSTVDVTIESAGATMASRLPTLNINAVYGYAANHAKYANRINCIGHSGIDEYAYTDRKDRRYMPFALYGYDMAPIIGNIRNAMSEWDEDALFAINLINRQQNLPEYTRVFTKYYVEYGVSSSWQTWRNSPAVRGSQDLGSPLNYMFSVSGNTSFAYTFADIPNEEGEIKSTFLKGGVHSMPPHLAYGHRSTSLGSWASYQDYTPTHDSSNHRFMWRSSEPLAVA